MSAWVIEAPSTDEWEIPRLGALVRVTESNVVRLLEHDAGFRIIEFIAPATWSPATTPPSTWT